MTPLRTRPPRTRLAPSPTGALHVGNARSFLLTWLHVRSLGGTVLLREDDLDGPRVKPGAMAQALDTLRWMGLDWDGHEGVLRQSERAAVYDAAANRLLEDGRAYPCVCTRREIDEAASAPHDVAQAAPAGRPTRYPGTCSGRYASLAAAREQTGRDAALRFVVPDRVVPFDDLVHGRCAYSPHDEVGDFPIRKRGGTAAYQLANVLDDAAVGVDLVIRGEDLRPSTSRQILLQEALGLARPRYAHLALVVGPDGRRLAKRHGDTRVASLRAAGWSPGRLVGFLGSTAGLAEPGEEVSAAALLDRMTPAALRTGTVVVRAVEEGARASVEHVRTEPLGDGPLGNDAARG